MDLFTGTVCLSGYSLYILDYGCNGPILLFQFVQSPIFRPDSIPGLSFRPEVGNPPSYQNEDHQGQAYHYEQLQGSRSRGPIAKTSHGVPVKIQNAGTEKCLAYGQCPQQ